MGWFGKKQKKPTRQVIDPNTGDIYEIDPETGNTVGNHRIIQALHYRTETIDLADAEDFLETHDSVGYAHDGDPVFKVKPGLNNKIFGLF